jgi:hypothetical protein
MYVKLVSETTLNYYYYYYNNWWTALSFCGVIVWNLVDYITMALL